MKTIIICGVGGQGIILASDILSDVLMEAGFDVKKSEVHGMSQRGGDVITTIRYGEKIYSPIVGEDSADLILAFEKLEALRTLKYLRKDGTMLINDYRWDPSPVATGTMEYPEEEILPKIREKTKHIQTVDALAKAKELGNIKVVNLYLLGLLAKELGLEKSLWAAMISRRVPPKAKEVNLKAFDQGYGEVRS